MYTYCSPSQSGYCLGNMVCPFFQYISPYTREVVYIVFGPVNNTRIKWECLQLDEAYYFEPNEFIMSLSCSQQNNRDELYILTSYRGYPETCLKLGDRVSQTSVAVVLVYQSTHAIHSLHDFRRNKELNSPASVTMWRAVIQKGVTGVPTK